MNRLLSKTEFKLFIFAVTVAIILCCGLKLLECKSVKWAKVYNGKGMR